MTAKKRRPRTTSQGEVVPEAKTPTGLPADGSLGLEELEHQIMSAALYVSMATFSCAVPLVRTV